MDLPQPDPAATSLPEPPSHGDLRRLWTPWRMRYVGGGAKETGCIFCNRLAAADDVRSLIVYRGVRCFVILNLFPYNTGHLMVVPNDHVAGPEQANAVALEEMARLLPPTLTAVRLALRCDGFNIGMNIGSVAGAGVADHLHQHVVPRWEGDANFMPILASTMVLPELLLVTYAKVRADLQVHLGEVAEVPLVVFDEGGRSTLTREDDGVTRLPRIAATGPGPIWVRSLDAASELAGRPVELAGWAGSVMADPRGVIALAFRTFGSSATGRPGDGEWSDTSALLAGQLADGDIATLQTAIAGNESEPPA